MRASLCVVAAAVIAATTPSLADNIAPAGTPHIGLADDLAGTNPNLHSQSGDPSEANDGVTATPGEDLTLPDTNGVDTWAGAQEFVAQEFDFVGVTWDVPANDVTSVSIQHYLANDGGWWGPTDTVQSGVALDASEITEPILQVTTDGSTWADIAATSDYVSGLTGAVRGTGFPNAVASPLLTFDFEEQDGILGIRLIGNPGGNAGTDANGFITVVDFQVEGSIVPEPVGVALAGIAAAFGLAGARSRRD